MPDQPALARSEARDIIKWLSDQVGGYTNWYYHSGVMYYWVAAFVQIASVVIGLIATVLAAAPHQELRTILGIEWHWVIVACTATVTVLSGAVPRLTSLARNREEGRVAMVRIRQELDVLTGEPTSEAYADAMTILDRIASVERRYGGGASAAQGGGGSG